MTRWSQVIVFGLCALDLIGVRAGLPTAGGAQGRETRASQTRTRERTSVPRITRPVMFNTPEADRILAALQVFPPDNPCNEDISNLPVHPNSKNILASVGANKS